MYNHCFENNSMIPAGEEVKGGNRYYHKKCLETKQNIEKTRDYYYENVSKSVVMSQLVKVLNQIVFDKDIDSEYLLFALQYAVENNLSIKSPYSLHYIIDYARVKSAWYKRNEPEQKEEVQSVPEIAQNVLEPKVNKSTDDEQVNQIYQIYQNHFNFNENPNTVKAAIKGFLRNSEPEYVKFVLLRAIDKNIPFKGIYTLGWLVKNDTTMKAKYDDKKAGEQVKDFDFNVIETNKKEATTYKKSTSSSWEDALFG